VAKFHHHPREPRKECVVHYFEKKDTVGSSYGKELGANLVMLWLEDNG
jgi:hypothetical protein